MVIENSRCKRGIQQRYRKLTNVQSTPLMSFNHQTLRRCMLWTWACDLCACIRIDTRIRSLGPLDLNLPSYQHSLRNPYFVC